MTWFAFRGYNKGLAVDIAGSQEKEAVTLGFHGYGTEKQAEAHPNDVAGMLPDPVLGGAQKEFVNAIIADYAAAKKEQAQPGGKNANILNPATAVSAGESYVVNSIPGFGALDALYQQVTKPSMWRSLGWLVLGGTMIGTGIYWWVKVEGQSGIKAVAGGKKPGLQAPVLPLTMMMTGLYLMWFSVKYWEDTEIIWPSDPVKAVLQGKNLPAHNEDISAQSLLTAAESASAESASAKGSGSASVPAGVSGSAQNQAHGLLSVHGWSATQFPALVSLWNRESGWSPTARNKSSGAFGIAQALGHGATGTAAPDGTNEYGGYGLSAAQAKAANSGSAYWQIVWGLNYIADTYGSPHAAWAHETSAGWY